MMPTVGSIFWACVWCGDRKHPRTLDHLVQRKDGGSNDASNLVLACYGCNSRRKSLTVRQWLKLLRSEGVDTDPIRRRVRRLGQLRRGLRRPRDAPAVGAELQRGARRGPRNGEK